MKSINKTKQTIFLILFLSFLYSCNKTQTLYLSDIKQGFIANEFGPPGKDISFEKNKLSIRDKIYDKGLGVHAPSKICLDINGHGEKFYASAGLDDEVRKARSGSLRQSLTKTADNVYDGNLDLSDLKQGGTARFNVYGDGKILLSTGWLSENSPPQEIELNIHDIKTLSLEVEKSPYGSFADHADWADARLTMKNKKAAKNLELYGSTSGILLNQTGFLPVSFKTFRTSESRGQKEFSIMDMSTSKAIFTGVVTEKKGDWGKVYIGDFSTVQTPGKYYVQFGDKASEPVSISSLQYVYNLEKHLNWFLSQRCGDPKHGWERGQHRDDGVRLDNRKHQDVSGGWHDAADLRKWGMTINGLWALSEVYLSLSAENIPDFGGKKELIARIKDEFNWGNKYYSAMQEPQGYLMEQVGGDVYKHGDNNRFTDNIPGTADDRWIVTKPNEPVFQYMFVIAQCNMALTEKPELRNSYILRATRCFNWATENKIVKDIHSLGAAQTASLKLYETTGNEKYLSMAEEYLKLILGRQDTIKRPAYGFIRSWKPGAPDPNNDFFPEDNLSYMLITPDFPIWSIVESIRVIKDPELNRKARQAFQIYVDHFVSYFDGRSSYGIVPLALYRKNPGGDRKAGDYFYRWCYVNHEDNEWWNGINPRIGYAGAILVRGGILTHNPRAVRIGQQQLDFIYGCNPFNASTVTGLGYNQPDYFKTSEFVPHTPETVGAVMAGIGSSENDLPVLLPGWWQTTEYWMEAVTGTVMLLNELNNYQFEKK
jgi:hypothetical protein